jgi:adenylylsulfate kinase
MKILIMGLPGSGKTWLAERLQKHLECAWYNADAIRKMANDWEFSEEARLRQARRMRNLADYEKGCGRTVICDFVCPTEMTRYIFEADLTVWMNTIQEGRFEDTNKMFEEPTDFDYIIEEFLSDDKIEQIAKRMKELYDV